jgi:LAS seventeen-binding protein 1/2
MNEAFINRSLTTVRNELEFLRDSKVITPALYEQWTNKLPTKYVEGNAPIDVSSDSSAPSYPHEKQEYFAPSGPPPPHSPGGQIAEALYNYEPRDPTDLPLYAGQRLIVLERLNPDWWKGRDLNSGREGIFPGNYVTMSDPGHRMAPPPPVSPYGAPAGYVPSPPPAASSPPYYPPPSTNYYQTAGPSQQPVVVEGQPQQHHTSDALKKFGSKLGNAAIFGAGATMGSDLVNHIL